MGPTDTRTTRAASRLAGAAASTPGPWRAIGQYIYGPKDVQQNWLGMADSPYSSLEEAHANARLIAAAPDMLAALNEVEEFLDDQADVVDGSYGEPAPNRAMSLLTEVRAAIAKAGQP